MSVLSIVGMSFRYRGQSAATLQDISLDIERGEIITILGGDGAGKSTLCKTLNGIVPDQEKGEFSGAVLLDGRNIKNLPRSEVVSRIGLAIQDPEAQLFTDSVEEEVAFAPENLGLPWSEIDSRVRRALSVTGLASLPTKSPSALSGGQKQRLAIASVISLLPSVLVLDEPLSMLDPRGRAELLAMLDSLKQERSMTVILTSNSAEEIAVKCDRIALLDRGRLVGVGRPEEILTSPDRLESIGVEPPQLLELSALLSSEKLLNREQAFFDEETGAGRILSAIGGRGGGR